MIIISIIGGIFILVFIFMFIYSVAYNVVNEQYYTPLFDIAKEQYKIDLQDNRWKNKRRKILERDNYRCVKCGYQHKLQVHHKYYERYPNNYIVKPWDYPDTALITLCDNCHKNEHRTHKIKTYYRKFGVHY